MANTWQQHNVNTMTTHRYQLERTDTLQVCLKQSIVHQEESLNCEKQIEGDKDNDKNEHEESPPRSRRNNSNDEEYAPKSQEQI